MAEQKSHGTSRADVAQAKLRPQEDAKGATVEVAVSGRRPRSGVPPRWSPLFLCPRRPGFLSTKSAEHTASHQGLVKDGQPGAPNVRGPSVPGRVARPLWTRPQVVKLTHSRPGSARLSAHREPTQFLSRKRRVLGARLGPAGACSYTPLPDPRVGESGERGGRTKAASLSQLLTPLQSGGTRSLDWEPARTEGGGDGPQALGRKGPRPAATAATPGCGVSFRVLSSNLAPQLRSFGGGGGGGGWLPSGLGSPGQLRGAGPLTPAPPTCPGPREQGSIRGGGGERGLRRPGVARGPATPSLPALGCRGSSPFTSRPHRDPSAANLQNGGAQVLPGGGARTPGLSSFPNFPLPSPAFF